jgi:hypothetical protein
MFKIYAKYLLANSKEKYCEYFFNSTRISFYLTGAYQEAFLND